MRTGSSICARSSGCNSARVTFAAPSTAIATPVLRHSSVSDVRRDLTNTFDVGLHGSMLSSLDANVSDQSLGIDVGMTLVKNVWISVGYNFAGFRDDDFEASRYLAQGPYIKFRMKADQDTFRDLLQRAR